MAMLKSNFSAIIVKGNLIILLSMKLKGIHIAMNAARIKNQRFCLLLVFLSRASKPETNIAIDAKLVKIASMISITPF